MGKEGEVLDQGSPEIAMVEVYAGNHREGGDPLRVLGANHTSIRTNVGADPRAQDCRWIVHDRLLPSLQSSVFLAGRWDGAAAAFFSIEPETKPTSTAKIES